MARRKVQLPIWNISSEQAVDKEFLNSNFSGISQGELVINVKSGNTIITTLDEKDNIINFESSVIVDEKINGVKEAIKELENEWGHQGPMGPQGADGVNGADGVQGPQGADGANGADGKDGADGAQGPQGADGVQGAQGADGKDGTSVTILGSMASESELPMEGNSNGDGYIINGYLHVWSGDKWNNVGEIKGPQGDKGETGAQGPQGADGANGADGAQGPQGADGVNGADGAQGPQGVDGVDGTNGTDGAQGPQGADGKDGTSVTILGSKTEENELPMDGNSNGDGYIIEGYLYVWSGDKWNNVGEIKGPQGDKGEAGTDGAQGPQGADGVDGTNGTDGAQGPQGADGKDGVDGTNGTDGAQGPQGADGLDGTNGTDGAQGPQGADGVQGPQGADGTQGPQGANGTDLTSGAYLPLTGGTISGVLNFSGGDTTYSLGVNSTDSALTISTTKTNPLYGYITSAKTADEATSAIISVSATTTKSAYTTTTDSKVYLLGTNLDTDGDSSLYKNTGVTMSASCIFATSDERLKDFYEDIDCNLDELKNIPKKYFSWKDDADKGRQIGTSAQELHKLYPEIVSIDDEGTHSVAYDRLSIVALAAIDKLYEENKELKERLKRIEEHLGL